MLIASNECSGRALFATHTETNMLHANFLLKQVIAINRSTLLVSEARSAVHVVILGESIVSVIIGRPPWGRFLPENLPLLPHNEVESCRFCLCCLPMPFLHAVSKENRMSVGVHLIFHSILDITLKFCLAAAWCKSRTWTKSHSSFGELWCLCSGWLWKAPNQLRERTLVIHFSVVYKMKAKLTA